MNGMRRATRLELYALDPVGVGESPGHRKNQPGRARSAECIHRRKRSCGPPVEQARLGAMCRRCRTFRVCAPESASGEAPRSSGRAAGAQRIPTRKSVACG
jgi:hypothetical protein